MKLLLDTHVLLWAAGEPRRLPAALRRLLNNPRNELLFSAASLWEIAIKRGLGRKDFRVDPRLLRRGLLENGYFELPVTGEHAVALDGLPAIHEDPFDRVHDVVGLPRGTARPRTASPRAASPASLALRRTSVRPTTRIIAVRSTSWWPSTDHRR